MQVNLKMESICKDHLEKLKYKIYDEDALGKGSFGRAYKVQDKVKKRDGAAKIMRFDETLFDDGPFKDQIKDQIKYMQREMQISNKIKEEATKSEYLIAHYETIHVESNGANILIFELACGDLESITPKCYFVEALFIFLQIVEGLEWMKEKLGMCRRDLSIWNVLVMKETCLGKSVRLYPSKITDVATASSPKKDKRQSLGLCTEDIIPPERVKKPNEFDSECSDLWAASFIFAMLVTVDDGAAIELKTKTSQVAINDATQGLKFAREDMNQKEMNPKEIRVFLEDHIRYQPLYRPKVESVSETYAPVFARLNRVKKIIDNIDGNTSKETLLKYVALWNSIS